MKILLPGAGGFIGSQILASLIKKYGAESVVVLSSEKIAYVNCVIYQSVHSFETEESAFDDVTHLIHAGAFIPKEARQANDIAACSSNIEYKKNLLSHKFKSLTRILNVSTSDVYAPTADKLSEKSCIRPISLYGSSKLYCEEMVKSFSEKRNTSYINLRIGHVYGPGEEKYRKVLPTAIENILNDKPVELWGDGSDLRSFIFIEDVVDSIMNALIVLKNNIDINVTSGKAVSILELLNTLISVSPKLVKIKTRESNHTKRNLVFDNRFLLRTLLKKETDLKHGLKLEYEYMKSKHENNI